MNRLALNIYSLYKIFIINIQDFIKLIKFSWFLQKNHVFREGNPKLVLKVIRGYLELESSNYQENIIRNRTPKDSYYLFSGLTKIYLKTNSSVTLNQLIEVLKEEFIKRED